MDFELSLLAILSTFFITNGAGNWYIIFNFPIAIGTVVRLFTFLTREETCTETSRKRIMNIVYCEIILLQLFINPLRVNIKEKRKKMLWIGQFLFFLDYVRLLARLILSIVKSVHTRDRLCLKISTALTELIRINIPPFFIVASLGTVRSRLLQA